MFRKLKKHLQNVCWENTVVNDVTINSVKKRREYTLKTSAEDNL